MRNTMIGIALLGVGFFLLPEHVQMGLKHNFADVDDYKLFSHTSIHKSDHPKPWPVSENYNKKSPAKELIDFFDERKTGAFLVIKDGKILYERYAQEYDKETLSGSFSMAKTVNALLIGKLAEQGKVSLEEDVKRYVPQLTHIPEGRLKLKDVITMSANFDWEESYWNIFSMTAESYYGSDLDKLMGKLRLRNDHQEGKLFEYQSCCTQILGYVIKNVTRKSLAENAQEYLWQPLGAESDALWSTDKNGMEKSFCCINATARDFARLGQMVLQHGKWDSVQVIDSAYIAAMTTPAAYLKDARGFTCDWYGYQTWMINYKSHQIPYFRGILGQFIFVVPDENAVIVRLGKKIKKDPNDPHMQNDDIRNYIEAGLQVLDDKPL
ncbi:MAG: serine hydrolase [Sphingobacteriales bacterium]|nr:serine hydrolase [Sphingobacteriales bacterium]